MKQEFPALRPSAAQEDSKTAQLQRVLEDHFTGEGFEEDGLEFYAVWDGSTPKPVRDALLLGVVTAVNAALDRQGSDLRGADYDGNEVAIPKCAVAALDEAGTAAVLESVQTLRDWSERSRDGHNRLTRIDDEIIFDPALRVENGTQHLVFCLRDSGGATERQLESVNALLHRFGPAGAGHEAPYFFRKGRTTDCNGTTKEEVYITEADAQRFPDGFWKNSESLGIRLSAMVPALDKAERTLLNDMLAWPLPAPKP